ncbi:MAG: hypothetical protein C0608_00270 [Deltaproteobacteria bacterium]|nr:MAG: hypothetical protein C0608_00270 [Deltaproteobacteria bacterium]
MTLGRKSGGSNAERIGGYLLGRAAVLIALIPVAASLGSDFGGGALHPSIFGFVVMAILSFGVTLVTSTLVLRKRAGDWLLKAQPVWDVFCATVLIFLTGGYSSPLILIYLFTIIGAAMLFFRKGAFVTATWATFAYLLVVLLQFNGYVNPIAPFEVGTVSGISLPFKIALNIAAFYSTAMLAGYLAEELRRTTSALKEARGEIVDLERLQTGILKSLASGLITFDLSGNIMFINDNGKRLLETASVKAEDAVAITGIFDLNLEGRGEAETERGDVTFGYNVVPLLNDEGAAAGKIINFQDLTELRKLSERLKQADRLAAIGRLAAGLAHEVRNPLASLSGSVELICGTMSPDSEKELRLLNIVKRETERLNNLVSGFLLYARPGSVNKSSFDFSLLVDEVALFLEQGEGRGVLTMVNNLPKGTVIKCDREKMEQVLINLFKNSLTASPGGVEVVINGGFDGSNFEFTFADNGPGVEVGLKNNIFEPFVSGSSSGSGLGLALVHRIAQNHGGSVALEDAPGGGALFRITLECGDD